MYCPDFQMRKPKLRKIRHLPKATAATAPELLPPGSCRCWTCGRGVERCSQDSDKEPTLGKCPRAPEGAEPPLWGPCCLRRRLTWRSTETLGRSTSLCPQRTASGAGARGEASQGSARGSRGWRLRGLQRGSTGQTGEKWQEARHQLTLAASGPQQAVKPEEARRTQSAP